MLARVRRFVGFMTDPGGRLGARVVRSGLWVVVSSSSKALLQMGRTMVLARLLTPEAFGLMGLCQIALRGLELFTELGTAPALVQRKERVEEAIDTAFVMQVMRGVMLTVLTIPVAWLASRFYEEPRLLPMVLALSATFFIGGFGNVRIVLLHKQMNFQRLTQLDLLTASITTVATIALAYIFRSAWALVIGQLINAVASMALTYYLVPERPSFHFDRAIARELFRYGRFITGITLVGFVTSEIDNLVVGKVIGLEALGVYSIAFILANLPATRISKVASVVLFPAYSSLQDDLPRLRLAYLTALRGIGGLALPVAAGLATLAPDVIRFGFGEKWLDAAAPLRVLSLYGGARAISVLAGYIYNAIGKPSISFYLALAKLLLIGIAIYPLTARYGLLGAATAMSVPQFAVDLFGLTFVQRHIGVPLADLGRVLGLIVLRTLAMVAALLLGRYWLDPITLLDLFALIGAGAAVYGLLSFRDLKQLYDQSKGRSKPARTGPPAATGEDPEP